MSETQATISSYSLVSTSLLANSVIFFVLATLAVALRIYARKVQSADLQWDDWTIIFSLVCLLFHRIVVSVGATADFISS